MSSSRFKVNVALIVFGCLFFVIGCRFDNSNFSMLGGILFGAGAVSFFPDKK